MTSRHFPRLFSVPGLELQPISDNMHEAGDFRVRLMAPEAGSGELVEMYLNLIDLTAAVDRMRDLFIADGLIAGALKMKPHDTSLSPTEDEKGAMAMRTRQRCRSKEQE